MSHGPAFDLNMIVGGLLTQYLVGSRKEDGMSETHPLEAPSSSDVTKLLELMMLNSESYIVFARFR